MNPEQQPLPTLPVTIHKHWIGLVAWFLVGLAGFGIAYISMASLMSAGQLTETNATILMVLVFAITLVTIERIWVYWLSTITFTNDGIIAINYLTIFAKRDGQAEWVRVQNASVVTGSIFNGIFDYGTLNIQTAGSYQDLRLPMLPNPEYWQSVVARLADQATVDGMDLSTTAAKSE